MNSRSCLMFLLGIVRPVGPRPHALGTKAGARALEDIVDNYSFRHCVRPGITGLAQINGCRGALRSEEQVRRRIEYDMFYIYTTGHSFSILRFCF